MTGYPLFDAYPMLAARVPRVSLGDFPTPVHRLADIGKETGLGELYIKRDDESSSHYGGNKVRKLELSLAAALHRGCRSVLTIGAAGSNHVLATIVHARRLGLATTAILFPQPPAGYVRANLLLDLENGADLFSAPSYAHVPFQAAWLMRGAALGGPHHPYFLTFGGSSPLTCLGYVNAAFELKRQVEEGLLPEPAYAFVTLGTLGTAAGLELGLRLAGMRTRTVGVTVVERWVCNARRWAGMINRTARLLHALDPSIPSGKVRPDELITVYDMLGEGYACFTREGVEAVRLMRQSEGIKLDGTYTGKTLAGALRFVQERGLKKEPLLFWHTLNSLELEVVDDDYRRLPPAFHHYFEDPLQPLDL